MRSSRTPRRCLVAGLFILVLLLVLPAAAAAQAQATEPLTVMTFNIRYGTAKDGENEWTARRTMLFDLVREQDADIIGLQEALAFQIDEIVAAAPGYATVGVGRDDGGAKGEFAAILFRRSRFRIAEAGTFWLSDTPAVPGSKTWGNTITRICTWTRLIDRDGRGFFVFNVHLDHQSQPSRERSTELLRQRIAARAFPSEPVVVTGDFNVGESNPALATLLGPAAPTQQESQGAKAEPAAPKLAKAGPFVDTFRVVRPDEKRVGTFTGFKFGTIEGDKIDYILAEPGTEVMHAEIVRFSRNDHYPSDHFPVVARIRLKPANP